MSKTKDMAISIGVDSRQNIDRDHDLYFVRCMFDLRRALEVVTPSNINPIKLNKMAGRYLFIYRNDDMDILRDSVDHILTYCESVNVKEIAFSEYELRGYDITDIVAKHNVEVYITIF
jgi:hypothetical protein